MKQKFSLALIFFMLAPSLAGAAISAPFEVSGWIPYWRNATGTAEFIAHIDNFKEINPFGYNVKNDGTLVDSMSLTAEPWPSLVKLLHLKQIRVVPTVMWSNSAAIDRVMRNPELRAWHEQQIVQMVYGGDYDGVDIDYEGKSSDTRGYFSLFLKELYGQMGKKWVECTIEARTPADSLMLAPGAKLQYANDYAVINKYCDRIHIMTYDQRQEDRKLSAASPSPYSPVADPKWVEKVLTLAERYFPKKKIMLGVATYGDEYRVTPAGASLVYSHLWPFNPRYATELADALGVTPQRNSAGELAFSYMATTSPATDGSYHLVTWSDASAIADKLALARRHGIRGVSIFKIDGGADPYLWTMLPK